MRDAISKVLPRNVIEWLIFATVVAILVALILPGVEWAASGEIDVPVRVVVFDALKTLPIEDARIDIVRALPADADFDVSELHNSIAARLAELESGDAIAKTDSKGSATIVSNFTTGASHTRPKAHAHMNWYWVLVSAKGYGSVAVPLRYESIPTEQLREQEFLPVSVGLAPQQ